MVGWLAAALVLSAVLVDRIRVHADHNITVFNNCDETLWPAVFSVVVPNTSFGYEAPSGSLHSFIAPPAWIGTIWARQGCDFDAAPSGNCAVGGCDALNCTQLGAGAYTTADLVANPNNTFGEARGHYLVNLFQGFNVPMMVSSSTPCKTVTCPVDLNQFCPLELRNTNGTGATISCSSACTAAVGDSTKNCCNPPYNTAAGCSAGNIDFYSYFHDNCPQSPATPFEAANNTGSNAACADNPLGDFKVTLCPTTHLVAVPPQVNPITADTTSDGVATPTEGVTSSQSPPATTSRVTDGEKAGVIAGTVLFIGLVAFAMAGFIRIRKRRAPARRRNLGIDSATFSHYIDSPVTREKLQPRDMVPATEFPSLHTHPYAFSGSLSSGEDPEADISGSSSVDADIGPFVQAQAWERAKQFIEEHMDAPS